MRFGLSLRNLYIIFIIVFWVYLIILVICELINDSNLVRLFSVHETCMSSMIGFYNMFIFDWYNLKKDNIKEKMLKPRRKLKEAFIKELEILGILIDSSKELIFIEEGKVDLLMEVLEQVQRSGSIV